MKTKSQRLKKSYLKKSKVFGGDALNDNIFIIFIFSGAGYFCRYKINENRLYLIQAVFILFT
jgi:hypothetical protein